MKLEIGYKPDFELRKESLNVKNAPDFTILYLSDLHLTSHCQRLVQGIIASVDNLNPSIVLLGGDYTETPKGLYYFEQLLAAISVRQNVFMIAGNHDYFWGISNIKNLCGKYQQIIWLENQSFCINMNGFKVQITGTKPQPRLEEADFNVLCLHQPIDIRPFHTQFDLVFAGHLHGCQIVFWETEKGLFPGRWFYRWNILKTQIGNCQYIISKGLGDTVPIRFNCRKDIVLVEISGKTNDIIVL